MIEKYFKAGICFRWVKPQDVSGTMDGTIVDSTRATAPLSYVGLGGAGLDPTLMFTHVSTFGLSLNMQIQHQWLDYSLGWTARVPIGPYDVLTGFMSGCVIARWVDRGVTYVGHLGTVDGYGTENRQVKRKFSFAMPKGTTGFSPANAWNFSDMQTIMRNVGKGIPPKIVALVTTSGEFYSIVMAPTGINTYQSGGIKRCNPIDHDTLKLQLLRD